MTITITLPTEAEAKLRRRAAEAGVTPDALARQLLEKILAGRRDVAPSARQESALDAVLDPFRKEVEESGMTDDELRDFFSEVRDEMRAEKRARRAQE